MLSSKLIEKNKLIIIEAQNNNKGNRILLSKI
jgi:hypothetical protein